MGPLHRDWFEDPCQDWEGAFEGAPASGAAVRLAAARSDDDLLLACSYAMPEGTLQPGSARWDADTNTWATVDAKHPPWAGNETFHVTGDVAVGLRSDPYMLATGRFQEIEDQYEVLTYETGWWTGDAYVISGCHYTEDNGMDAPFVASVWREGAGWTIAPSPYEGICPEAAPSVWTGTIYLVFVDGDDLDHHEVLTFDPGTATWGTLGQLASVGHAIPTDDGVLLTGNPLRILDPVTGDVTASSSPTPARAWQSPVWTGEHLVYVDRDPATPDVAWTAATDTWMRLPALPDANAPCTLAPVVQAVAGDVLVWGGQADPMAPSRNAGDGFVLRIGD